MCSPIGDANDLFAGSVEVEIARIEHNRRCSAKDWREAKSFLPTLIGPRIELHRAGSLCDLRIEPRGDVFSGETSELRNTVVEGANNSIASKSRQVRQLEPVCQGDIEGIEPNRNHAGGHRLRLVTGLFIDVGEAY